MSNSTLGNESWSPVIKDRLHETLSDSAVKSEGTYPGPLPMPSIPMPPMPTSFKPSNPKDVMGINKAPMSTVSELVMAEVGVAMFEGALKYGRHNYRVVGVLASIYYDATRRHLRAWWEGQNIDKRSGLHHITKAITSLVVLRDAMIVDMYTDDRPPAMSDEAIDRFFDDLDAHAAMLLARDGHIQPQHYTEINKGG